VGAAVDGDGGRLVLGGAAVTSFAVFLGVLRATLRREEGEAGALSATAVIAGSVVAAGALVAVALDLPEARVALAFPTAALVLASSAAILWTGALDRIAGYAGIAVVLLQLPAGASVAEEGAFSPDGMVPTVARVAFLGWIALASVTILRHPS